VLGNAGGANTTISGVVRAAHGWRVVTLTVFSDDQHASTLALARRLLPQSSPLGRAPLGTGRSEPVFFVEATIRTGSTTNKVFEAHIMLVSANTTGPHTGQTTAVAYPPDGFVKVGVTWAKVFWLAGAPCQPANQLASLSSGYTAFQCACP